ncbi:hypothetical protein DFH08DRAFT_942269 [Mycena albidolilacea]|uniref:Uncharacterized protein n=1 Tax=Mycena albidolilacea TaxID=1033008 RepID=A0AAD6ZEJ9_9AGAR|nr:hypothetical protein DFH08DRAFT_942269 [Mycena albidolilacea]
MCKLDHGQTDDGRYTALGYASRLQNQATYRTCLPSISAIHPFGGISSLKGLIYKKKYWQRTLGYGTQRFGTSRNIYSAPSRGRFAGHARRKGFPNSDQFKFGPKAAVKTRRPLTVNASTPRTAATDYVRHRGAGSQSDADFESTMRCDAHASRRFSRARRSSTGERRTLCADAYLLPAWKYCLAGGIRSPEAETDTTQLYERYFEPPGSYQLSVAAAERGANFDDRDLPEVVAFVSIQFNFHSRSYSHSNFPDYQIRTLSRAYLSYDPEEMNQPIHHPSKSKQSPTRPPKVSKHPWGPSRIIPGVSKFLSQYPSATEEVKAECRAGQAVRSTSGRFDSGVAITRPL